LAQALQLLVPLLLVVALAMLRAAHRAELT
jgi:hypothetical protein